MIASLDNPVVPAAPEHTIALEDGDLRVLFYAIILRAKEDAVGHSSMLKTPQVEPVAQEAYDWLTSDAALSMALYAGFSVGSYRRLLREVEEARRGQSAD